LRASSESHPETWIDDNSKMQGMMKILATEIEAEGIRPEQYQLHLKAQARRDWELYQTG
jgi:hypothetical protein